MSTPGYNFTASHDGSVYDEGIYTRTEAFSWTIGLFLGATVFGAICTLCILNFNLLRKRRQQEREKHGRISTETTCMFLNIFWMCLLCSGILAVELISTLPHPVPKIIETDRAFQNLLSGLPESIVGIACFSMVHWAFEILLIWRSYVIYRNSREKVWFLLSFAGFIFLASVASGAFLLVEVIMGNSDFATKLVVVHGGICLFSNLVFTHMIIVRLLLYRRSIIRLVGRKYAGHYTSVASIIIESGILMNVVIIALVVAVVLNHQWLSIPLLIFPLIEALLSYLIVFRVADGSAWSSSTANELIAQHAVTGRETTVLTNERLSAHRYRASVGTQASTAFRFNHRAPSSNLSQILDSQVASRRSSIRVQERYYDRRMSGVVEGES